MSIASPKLPPLILSTNGNGKLSNNSSPTIMKKEVNNNDLSTLSKVNHHHHLAQTSEESDDDKPLVMMTNRHVFTIDVDLLFFSGSKSSSSFEWFDESEEGANSSEDKERTKIGDNFDYCEERNIAIETKKCRDRVR